MPKVVVVLAVAVAVAVLVLREDTSAVILNCFDLHCTLAAAQCIVIAPVCLWVGGWVCYHDNSKLCALILAKPGL